LHTPSVYFFCTVLKLACWTARKDAHGPVAVARTLTLSQCKAACIKDSRCVAIDWHPGNRWKKTCWTLTSTHIERMQERGHITNYLLDRRCLRESYFYSHILIMCNVGYTVSQGRNKGVFWVLKHPRNYLNFLVSQLCSEIHAGVHKNSPF